MTSLFSFNIFHSKNSTSKSPSAKHEKLSENWGNNEKAVLEGVTFSVKYLGSTLLEELEEGKSYGNKISAEAVGTIVSMARGSNKKPIPMTINVSPERIKVENAETKEVFTDLSIYRIHFCTADKNHEKVFAYIARSTENETMECHAFLCPKKKIAEAVTLTVAESFQIAKKRDEEKEDEARREKEQAAFRQPDTRAEEVSDAPVISKSPAAPVTPAQPATGVLISLDEPPASTPDERGCDGQQRGAGDGADSAQGFDDNFTDADPFASFVESRISKSPHSASETCEVGNCSNNNANHLIDDLLGL